MKGDHKRKERIIKDRLWHELILPLSHSNRATQLWFESLFFPEVDLYMEM